MRRVMCECMAVPCIYIWSIEKRSTSDNHIFPPPFPPTTFLQGHSRPKRVSIDVAIKTGTFFPSPSLLADLLFLICQSVGCSRFFFFPFLSSLPLLLHPSPLPPLPF